MISVFFLPLHRAYRTYLSVTAVALLYFGPIFFPLSPTLCFMASNLIQTDCSWSRNLTSE